MASKKTKERANKRAMKRRKLGLKRGKPIQKSQKSQRKKSKPIPKSKNPIQDEDPILFGSGPGSGSGSEPDEEIPTSPSRIYSLLEPYTKPQLISFLLDAALSDPELRTRIRTLADSDISHRKLFVHGLSWDTTKEDLAEVFASFGPIEDFHVVVDKLTGRTKGYGFVLFETRAAAEKALKQPQKQIKNRLASCQLASFGPPDANAGVVPATEGRKVYVSNVHVDCPADKLRAVFEKFGELESGPNGFDPATGKSRGYAIFAYKNQEGVKRALEEPHKLFEGHQLHCRLATDSSQKAKTAAVVGAVPPQPLLQQPVMFGAAPQPVLAAVAAQNLALLGQNPAYSALLAQNPLLMAALNPAAAGLWNSSAVFGQGYGGFGMGGAAAAPYGGGAPSVLGVYSGVQGIPAGLQGFIGYQGSLPQAGQPSGLQGLIGYQGSSSQAGQTSSSRKDGGTYGGFSSSSV